MPVEGLGHECGLFAIWAPGTNVAWVTVRALDGQQTRGQEGAGVVTTDGRNFFVKKERGLVVQVFPNPRSVRKLKGFAAIGHTRYSTTGRDKIANVQPLQVESRETSEEICLAHNGNLVNATVLKSELIAKGEVFRTTTDSEVVAKLLIRTSGKTWAERLRAVMEKLEGSYCLAILTKEQILVCRDQTGNRPLTIGKINGNWEAASESGVFNNQPSEFIREVEPGEIVVFDHSGLTSYPMKNPTAERALCSFEWIYFLRPDSVFGGVRSALARSRAGEFLARRHPVEADLIVPIPRSGFWAAGGYHRVSRIPLEHAVVSNLHVRVFINPSQHEREGQYDLKYSVLPELVEGKRIVIIDDSIVRGNSNKRVLAMFKRAGAAEIHFRSTFPPIIRPCHLGIDMHTESELIAASFGSQVEVEAGLARFWEIESVGYLSRDDLIAAIGLPESMLCTGCVGGRYAYDSPASGFTKDQFELVTR